MSPRSLLKLFSFILFIKISACSQYAENILQKDHQNFTFLSDVTCAIAKDELEKHPEMQTIALIELQNNFTLLSREIFKCLPADVAKLSIMPHTPYVTKELRTFAYHNLTLMLPKQSLIIYVTDKVEPVRKFSNSKFCFTIFQQLD